MKMIKTLINHPDHTTFQYTPGEVLTHFKITGEKETRISETLNIAFETSKGNVPGMIETIASVLSDPKEIAILSYLVGTRITEQMLTKSLDEQMPEIIMEAMKAGAQLSDSGDQSEESDPGPGPAMVPAEELERMYQ